MTLYNALSAENKMDSAAGSASSSENEVIDLNSALELPVEVIVSLFTTLGKQDVLDETNFSVEDALNNLFPDGELFSLEATIPSSYVQISTEASLARTELVQLRLRNLVQDHHHELALSKQKLAGGESGDRMAPLQELIGVRFYSLNLPRP